jgi:hypothetical protein
MKLPKIPSFKREPKTPEQLESAIAARAARQAARIAARGKARTKLDEAKDGIHVRPMSVIIINWSVYAALIAAIAIIAAGYWYDLLFYGQQHDDIAVVIGLIAFAFVVRTVATAGDVILHWSKPEHRRDTDPSDGMKAIIGDNRGVRWSLRVMWIGSILACSVATLSFFSAGHEKRVADAAGITATETGIMTSKKERIDALEAQKKEALEARNTVFEAADNTIAAIKDETPGISVADNETIQKANDSKDAATIAYNDTVKDLNDQINAINAEKEEEIKQVTVERVTAIPFLSVYQFLSRLIGNADGWTIVGAWFFSALFELLCAKLLSTVFALMKIVKRVSRAIEMREAADEMNARIALERMRSNIEIDAIRLRSAQAQERALADIDLAQRERMVEKARAQAEAIRTGAPWIDPDDLLNVETALRRAETEARIRKIEERAAKIAAGEIDPDAPEVDASPEPPRPKDPNKVKGAESTNFTKETDKIDDSLPIDEPGAFDRDQGS